ncbi:MaoC family dehydratase [Roseiconus lacunae]|uniref:MaoC family dehydratase n=1 Tax=Roseiconus lacunae TaxID=2605694 RepID=UPI00135B5BF4|nr:MaoC/PaaZ C-terminal domain-containing protein [Roseiconus lacunae]
MNESELAELRDRSSSPSAKRQAKTTANDPARYAKETQYSNETLYAEDLSEGDRWETEFREISGSDVNQFAALTGDHTAIHADGTESPFGKPIAHGLLGLSVLAGLGTQSPNAATLALVSIDEWKFLAPVFFGDRVRARNEILTIEPHGRRAVKVFWLRSLLNESERVVQQGQFVTIVARKNRAAKPR